MIKVLSFRFQQPLRPFTMLLFEESSETGVITIDLTRFSESVISEIDRL